MGDVVPLVPEPPSAVPDDPAGAAARAAQAAVGAVALTLGTMAEVIRQAAGLPDVRPEDRDPAEPKEGAALVAGAALGAATEAMRTAASIVDAGARAARPMAVAGASVAAPLRRVSEDLLRRWDQAWEGERPEAESLAGAVASEATRRTVDAILDQLDLTAIVHDRVDLDAVVGTLDLDAVVDRIDVDAIVARVDVDAIAARIDPNAIAGRVDVSRIIERIDLSALALEVIDRIDLPEIIRASTGAVASDTVRTVRLESISADRAVARFVDRLLGRRREEDPTEEP